MTFHIEIRGERPEATADEIDTILGQNGIIADRTPILPEEAVQRGLGETLGIIGFVLALPGAVEDWTGYPAKQKTRELLRTLIEQARTFPADADLRLRYGDGRSINLRAREADSIIDELALLRRP